jgi:hypothetical protein
MKTINVRKVFALKMAAVATATWTSKQINVPIDATRNAGILITGMEFETSLKLQTYDTKSWIVILSTEELAAEEYIDDREVIRKCKLVSGDAADKTHESADMVKYAAISPAYPVFQDEIYVNVYQDSGAACDFYFRIYYKTAFFSRQEQNEIFKNRHV